jgi:hypothetical protein
LIYLEWSDAETTFERLDPREAIKRLLILRGDHGYPRDPRVLLDLAELPTLLLRRPKSRSGLDAAVAEIGGLLFESGGGRRYAGSRVSSCHGW